MPNLFDSIAAALTTPALTIPLTIHFPPPSMWFRAVCGLAVVMLFAGLLWNPVGGVVAADHGDAAGMAMIESLDDPDLPQPHAPSPADVDATYRSCRMPGIAGVAMADLTPMPGPVPVPPERPPRA